MVNEIARFQRLSRVRTAPSRFQDGDEFFVQDLPHAAALLDALVAHARADGADQRFGGGKPGIGGDEDFFELVPEVVVVVGAFEEATDAAKETAARAFERLLGLLVDLGLVFRRDLDYRANDRLGILQPGFIFAVAAAPEPHLPLRMRPARERDPIGSGLSGQFSGTSSSFKERVREMPSAFIETP